MDALGEARANRSLCRSAANLKKAPAKREPTSALAPKHVYEQLVPKPQPNHAYEDQDRRNDGKPQYRPQEDHDASPPLAAALRSSLSFRVVVVLAGSELTASLSL